MVVKKKFVCTIDCPYCGDSIDILKESEVIVPAVPAERNERFIANKNLQKKLS